MPNVPLPQAVWVEETMALRRWSDTGNELWHRLWHIAGPLRLKTFFYF